MGNLNLKLATALLACFTAIAVPAAWAGNEVWPDENKWLYIGEQSGVAVYWRFRHELRDQVISEMKLQNNNGYKVDVSVASHFVCRNGTDFIGSGGLITLRPGQSKGGQWEGMFDYPCPGSQPPLRGGYKNMRVKKAD